MNNNTKLIDNQLKQFRKATEWWFFHTAKSTVTFFRKSFTQRGWDGQPWSLRNRKYDWPILRKPNPNGMMYDSFKIDRGNNSYTITNTKEYASFHNDGTEKLPKRQFMVENTSELPKTFQKILIDRLDNQIAKIFK